MALQQQSVPAGLQPGSGNLSKVAVAIAANGSVTQHPSKMFRLVKRTHVSDVDSVAAVRQGSGLLTDAVIDASSSVGSRLGKGRKGPRFRKRKPRRRRRKPKRRKPRRRRRRRRRKPKPRRRRRKRRRRRRRRRRRKGKGGKGGKGG